MFLFLLNIVSQFFSPVCRLRARVMCCVKRCSLLHSQQSWARHELLTASCCLLDFSLGCVLVCSAAFRTQRWQYIQINYRYDDCTLQLRSQTLASQTCMWNRTHMLTDTGTHFAALLHNDKYSRWWYWLLVGEEMPKCNEYINHSHRDFKKDKTSSSHHFCFNNSIGTIRISALLPYILFQRYLSRVALPPAGKAAALPPSTCLSFNIHCILSFFLHFKNTYMLIPFRDALLFTRKR